MTNKFYEITQADIDNKVDVVGLVNPSKVSFGSSDNVVVPWTSVSTSVQHNLLTGVTLQLPRGLDGMRLEIRDLKSVGVNDVGNAFLGIRVTRTGESVASVTTSIRTDKKDGTSASVSSATGNTNTSNLMCFGSTGKQNADIDIDFKAWLIRDGGLIRETVGMFGRSTTSTMNDATNQNGAAVVDFVTQAYCAVTEADDFNFPELWLYPQGSNGTFFASSFTYRILKSEMEN